MRNGKEEAVHLFVEEYTKTLGKSNMDSFMFCQYMLINIQVGVMKFVEKMGVEKANIDRTFKDYKQQMLQFQQERKQRSISKNLSYKRSECEMKD